MIRYAICATPRSGSSWFCDMLSSLAIGDPWEVLNPDQAFREWRQNVGLPPDVPTQPEEFDRLAVAVSRLGVSGVKLFADHPGALAYILHVAPKCVRLRRRNPVEQAISLYRAEASGKWRSDQPDARPDPEYDERLIDEKLDYVRRVERAWDEYLPPNTPTLWYEDVLVDPLGALRTVAYLLDVPAPCVAPASKFQVQRDAKSAEWAARYGNR